MTTSSSKQILLVTTRLSELQPFAEQLSRASGIPLQTAASAAQALAAARRPGVTLAVVDSHIGTTSGLELIRQLIAADAFIHTAALNDAAEEDFHEQSEGLGVLAQLPLAPGADDARRLCELLRGVLG